MLEMGNIPASLDYINMRVLIINNGKESWMTIHGQSKNLFVTFFHAKAGIDQNSFLRLNEKTNAMAKA